MKNWSTSDIAIKKIGIELMLINSKKVEMINKKNKNIIEKKNFFSKIYIIFEIMNWYNYVLDKYK